MSARIPSTCAEEDWQPSERHRWRRLGVIMILGYRVCPYTQPSSVRDANETPLHSSSPLPRQRLRGNSLLPRSLAWAMVMAAQKEGAEKANRSASLVSDQSCHLVTVTAICSMLGTRQLNLIQFLLEEFLIRWPQFLATSQLAPDTLSTIPG